jgi:dsRNA-specific ribonuclease
MAEFGVFPTYRTVNDTGLEGDDARFTVDLLIREQTVASGTARSKREAERRAASAAHAERERLAEELAPSAPGAEGGDPN